MSGKRDHKFHFIKLNFCENRFLRYCPRNGKDSLCLMRARPYLFANKTTEEKMVNSFIFFILISFLDLFYSNHHDNSPFSFESLIRGAHHHSQQPLFDIRRVFPHKTVENDPPLFDAMQKYINEHHKDVVINDPNFCNRSFTYATYACPQAMGNHMHEFLNGFVGSFITNRTLVWTFCERKPCRVDVLSDCDEVVTRHPWILSYNDFVKAHQDHKCSWPNTPYELIGQPFRGYVEEIAMCCGIDKLENAIPIINFGNHELHQFYSLSVANARLLPISKERAHLLFRHGEDYGYGVMLRSSFQIKSFIIERNNELIRKHIEEHQLVNPFFISLHLRHATNTDTKDLQDNSGYNCLHKILGKFNSVLQLLPPPSDSPDFHQYHMEDEKKKRPCVLLFASDRPESIDYWGKWKVINNKINCTVLTTNHSKSHIQWTEHGPFTGEIAVSDIDLLSRGDILLGSSYLMAKLANLVSSFSLLIAELRATNSLEYSINFKSKWLPECEEVIGAARSPRSMFHDHRLDCRQIVEFPVVLHDACPYANQSFPPIRTTTPN